ncbi:MAG TPA: class I SAM-dependent methyltransferase [Opitutaceae bacterium]
MRIRASDTILEVGCGHGVAADLICRQLTSGRLVAIDRSPAMIAAAVRRNASHIKAGLATFHLAAFETFDPGDLRFDIVLAVRVGLFHRDPGRARRLVSRWLKPGGRLVAVYDEP